MEIIIKGEEKELAAFVLETQGLKDSEQGQPKAYYIGDRCVTISGDGKYTAAYGGPDNTAHAEGDICTGSLGSHAEGAGQPIAVQCDSMYQSMAM